MTNIFREVDEDIRKERYINLLKKYGRICQKEKKL